MRNVMTCIVLGLAAAAAASDGALAQTRGSAAARATAAAAALADRSRPGAAILPAMRRLARCGAAAAGNVIVPQTRCVWALRAR